MFVLNYFNRTENQNLNHLAQQSVDLVLAVTEVTTVDVVVGLLAPASGGGVQFERPEEVGGVLEVGSNGEDLMHQILNALNAVRLAQFALNNKVIGDWHTLAVVLDIAALVDQLADGLQVGVAPGDVGLSNAQHVDGGLVQLDEHTIVDLAQTEQLQHLADLGGNLVDTASR